MGQMNGTHGTDPEPLGDTTPPAYAVLVMFFSKNTPGGDTEIVAQLLSGFQLGVELALRSPGLADRLRAPMAEVSRPPDVIIEAIERVLTRCADRGYL